MNFAEILLPVPLNRMFTYALPPGVRAQQGMRVVVPFGKRKFLTGVVINIHDKAPEEYEAKEVTEILDDAPVLSAQQLEFIFWMAEYYLCTAGEVLNAALPGGLKISSESSIQLNPSYFEYKDTDLADAELKVVESLEHNHSMSYNDVVKLIGASVTAKIIKSLERKGLIDVYEELKERYVPKREKFIRLSSEWQNEKALEQLFKDLEAKPKQEEVLLTYLQLIGVEKIKEKGVQKKVLKEKDISGSSLNTLIKNNVFEEYEVEISRFEHTEISNEIPQLADFQKKALDEILNEFQEKDQVLLHGITGSGKTEIYINLIKDVVDSGHQALLLLPEIALTTQIMQRLKKVFGNQLGVYHSKFSENERVEVWMGVLSGRFPIVVGVRSSLFLPFDNLGLVIIDEEHETTYKQYDPAPRYHARDAALMLSSIHKAKSLLGSASPSIETFFQAEAGKYGYVSLQQRFGDASLPDIQTVDLSEAIKKRKVNGHFTEILLERIKEALANKHQVIIFQNRRGYAPFLECQNCGSVPKCINCAVSLTYHQYQQQLRCHYCGYHQKMPNQCEECSSTLLQTMGFGTEKLEEDLQLLIPEAKIQRMDLETTRAKNSYQRIIEDFTLGKTDILIGTQMVTKGLDFKNVVLVGIVDFDRMLHFPDFRSYERTFNLTLQVSGRAGRSKQSGEVIIQSYNPKQLILDLLKASDYKQFYERELSERSRFNYPPYTRLITITLKHRDRSVANDGARSLANALQRHFDQGIILGPEPPMINRIKNRYLMDITLKFPRRNFNLHSAKEILKHESMLLQRHPVYKNIQIVFDVDPF